MTISRKPLFDRLRSGELVIPTEAEADTSASSLEDYNETMRFFEETRANALSAPRKAGRPAKVAARRQTEVRGLRLEVSLWRSLEGEANRRGCSINRYIEESVLARLGLMAFPINYFAAEAASGYSERKPWAFPSRMDNIVRFERPAVAC